MFICMFQSNYNSGHKSHYLFKIASCEGTLKTYMYFGAFCMNFIMKSSFANSLSNRDCQWFMLPIICRPMDLTTLKKNIENGVSCMQQTLDVGLADDGVSYGLL